MLTWASAADGPRASPHKTMIIQRVPEDEVQRLEEVTCARGTAGNALLQASSNAAFTLEYGRQTDRARR